MCALSFAQNTNTTLRGFSLITQPFLGKLKISWEILGLVNHPKLCTVHDPNWPSGKFLYTNYVYVNMHRGSRLYSFFDECSHESSYLWAVNGQVDPHERPSSQNSSDTKRSAAASAVVETWGLPVDGETPVGQLGRLEMRKPAGFNQSFS